MVVFGGVWLDNFQGLEHGPSSSVAPHVQRRERTRAVSPIPWAGAAVPVPSTHGCVDGPRCRAPGSVTCTAPTAAAMRRAIPPKGGKAEFGSSSLSCSRVPARRVSSTWQLGPGSCCCFVAHHNLLLAPSPPSATPTLLSVPLHQGLVRSIAWIFGDEVASLSFSRQRGSWHIPGAGLLAVLRGRAKAGGARGDQEEMLEQV